MEDILDIDSPLAHYKLAFPDDKNAEAQVLAILQSTAKELTGKYYVDLSNIEQDGLSRLELDIHTLFKIDVLREQEIL